jgi:AcrR family transcriptional regulator
MPLIVDREKRRRKVAAIATKMIAREGPDAVTVRDVAAAAGYSTKVISHYSRARMNSFWGRAAFNEAFALEQHASAAMAQRLIIVGPQIAD